MQKYFCKLCVIRSLEAGRSETTDLERQTRAHVGHHANKVTLMGRNEIATHLLTKKHRSQTLKLGEALHGRIGRRLSVQSGGITPNWTELRLQRGE